MCTALYATECWLKYGAEVHGGPCQLVFRRCNLTSGVGRWVQLIRSKWDILEKSLRGASVFCQVQTALVYPLSVQVGQPAGNSGEEIAPISKNLLFL